MSNTVISECFSVKYNRTVSCYERISEWTYHSGTQKYMIKAMKSNDIEIIYKLIYLSIYPIYLIEIHII